VAGVRQVAHFSTVQVGHGIAEGAQGISAREAGQVVLRRLPVRSSAIHQRKNSVGGRHGPSNSLHKARGLAGLYAWAEPKGGSLTGPRLSCRSSGEGAFPLSRRGATTRLFIEARPEPFCTAPNASIRRP